MKVTTRHPDAPYIKIWLDDVLQTYCVFADDIDGYVLRHKQNADGTIRQNKYGNTEVERVYGNVVIKIERPANGS